MLKITTESVNTKASRIYLHGHFTAEYVTEIEKTLLSIADKGQVTLDLQNVTFVDRAAMEFLRRINSTPTKIENTPSYVTRWIEQEVS